MEEQEMDEFVSQTIAAFALILEKHGRQRGVNGHIICPRCGNTLRYITSSYNGHIHGKCDTENCLELVQ